MRNLFITYDGVLKPFIQRGAADFCKLFLLSFVLLLPVMIVQEGGVEFLLSSLFWSAIVKAAIILFVSLAFLLQVARFVVVSLLVLAFWCSTPFVTASFAFDGGSSVPVTEQSYAPVNYYTFGQTNASNTTAATSDAICYKKVVAGQQCLVINLTKAVVVQDKIISDNRAKIIEDIVSYTIAKAPLCEDALDVLLGNVANIYTGVFKTNYASNKTLQDVKINTLELLTYGRHVQLYANIKRSLAAEFIKRSFHCQLKRYNTYHKLGEHGVEHKYFKFTETISDWIDEQKA